MAVLQIHIYICLPDRNYAQQDSCLPDEASVHEDLADAAPLAHDDLGCPIRRDRLYQDSMGAAAKSLSGPPVSPSLFRSPRSSASERPSPKAIQASIKESATLAAAISMQWKEEVSAMRRELADLRRDLCKELRAFNSNFNTFTQHYNTWSPQAGNMSAGADVGFDRGTGTGSRPGPGAGGRGGRGTSAPNRGAREKKLKVSKVSVGTQARPKVLVRQSTADAAVNCPEDKDDKKSARRSLPKQLSMDPSILACPQLMYEESAIPLSLDPILPALIKTLQPDPTDTTAEPSGDRAAPEMPTRITVSSAEIITNKPTGNRGVASATAPESPEEAAVAEEHVMQITPRLIRIDPVNEDSSNTHASHSDETPSPDPGLIDRDKILIPYPVPVVTVSPPEEPGDDNLSESESLDPVSLDTTQPESQETAAVVAATDPAELEPKSPDTPVEPSGDTGTQFDVKCPSIVVSEYNDTDSPASPAESDPGPVLITFPDDDSDLPREQTASVSTVVSSCAETELYSDPETQDSEWPPLPEPLDTAPIYHADLVHFDLVMLTSLDQDDLDSVFMDPEPEPFDLSIDSPSNTDDLYPPAYHSDCSGSPDPVVEPAMSCSFYPGSTDSVCLDPAMDYRLSHTPQEAASEFPLPVVTVTISPPSSVSPDISLELDFGPTSPASDLPTDENPSPPEYGDAPSGETLHTEPDVLIEEPSGCMTLSQENVEPAAAAAAESPAGPERSTCEQAFLWCRWQKRGQRRASMNRSGSVELWSRRYEYNSAEITYVSLTL